MQAQTKIKLGATAGLRLLPEGKADIILDEVRKFLKTYPFQLDTATGVTILDGEIPQPAGVHGNNRPKVQAVYIKAGEEALLEIRRSGHAFSIYESSSSALHHTCNGPRTGWQTAAHRHSSQHCLLVHVLEGAQVTSAVCGSRC